MTIKNIAFWASTGLFALAMGAGGLADITGNMAEAMTALGYPLYFATIIGIWKILGVAALFTPGFDKVKEWAYAGFFFNLTGAAASHFFVGDGLGGMLPPLLLLGLAAVSYTLKDADRSAVSSDALRPVAA